MAGKSVEVDTNLKSKLKRLGFRLLLGGILLTVLGTGTQIYIFITSEGEAPANSPGGMIWSGVIAALGILILFAGAVLRMLGRFEQGKEIGAEINTDVSSDFRK